MIWEHQEAEGDVLSFSEEEFHGWGHQMGRGGAGHKRPPAQTQVPPGPGGAEHPTPTSLSVLCHRASAKHECVNGSG